MPAPEPTTVTLVAAVVAMLAGVDELTNGPSIVIVDVKLPTRTVAVRAQRNESDTAEAERRRRPVVEVHTVAIADEPAMRVRTVTSWSTMFEPTTVTL
jgi:hypothetical protein